jgi:hypothetical protein
VRDDTRIRHPDTKRVLAFLDVARIHTRKGNPNSNFACAGRKVFHVTDNKYIPRSALFFVPSCFHNFA